MLDRGVDLLLEADVQGQGERLAARGLDLGSGGVDGARQLGMGRLGLAGDDDVGAVARRAHRNIHVMDGQVTDLKPYAARGVAGAAVA